MKLAIFNVSLNGKEKGKIAVLPTAVVISKFDGDELPLLSLSERYEGIKIMDLEHTFEEAVKILNDAQLKEVNNG